MTNKIKKVTTSSAPTKNNIEGQRNTPHQTHRPSLQKRAYTKKEMRCEPRARLWLAHTGQHPGGHTQRRGLDASHKRQHSGGHMQRRGRDANHKRAPTRRTKQIKKENENQRSTKPCVRQSNEKQKRKNRYKSTTNKSANATGRSTPCGQTPGKKWETPSNQSKTTTSTRSGNQNTSPACRVGV